MAVLTNFTLTLRHRSSLSRSEITQVCLSSSSSSTTTTALAVYPTTQQSWIDTFSLSSNIANSSSSNSSRTLTSLSKTSGSRAAPAPDSSGRIATLRDWTAQLSGGAEHHHSSSVLIRDPRSRKPALEIRAAPGSPLAWSHDARLIAALEASATPSSNTSGASGERMGVWDARTGTLVGRVASHIDRIAHAAFTPEGRLVTASRDGTLRITDVRAGRTVARLEMEGSGNPRALGVSPDGGTVVSIWGASVHVWHPARGGEIMSYGLGAVRETEGWPLCVSPDCRFLACRTEDGFDIMEVSSGTVVCAVESDVLVTAAAFSADSSMLLLGRMDGVVEVWDLEQRKN